MSHETPARGVDAARVVLDDLLPLFTRTRQQRGLSLRAVATQLGCGNATLSEWQTGKHEPRLSLVRAIVAWIAGEQPATPDDAQIGTLTAAQRSVLDHLLAVDGYPELSFLGITPGGYRLIVPRLAGDPPHADVGLYRRVTVRALEQAGLVRIGAAVYDLPPFERRDHDPRGAARFGWRVAISREVGAHGSDASDQRPGDEPLALQQELPVPDHPPGGLGA